jgi:hypothetical protein
VGAHSSVVGWGAMLQAGRSPVRVPDEVNFFHVPNPSSRIMALGSTQRITEMSTRNLPGGKMRPAHRPDIILLPSMSQMSENVGASTSRNLRDLHSLYRDDFTFTMISPPTGVSVKITLFRDVMSCTLVCMYVPVVPCSLVDMHLVLHLTRHKSSYGNSHLHKGSQ